MSALTGSRSRTAHTLTAIGQLALELHAANNEIRSAKHSYHEAIARYEGRHGCVSRSFNPREKQYAGVIKTTKGKYAAYQAARCVAYNVKRRLDTACRNFSAGQRISALVQKGVGHV